jgi:hypothetical protein
MAIIRLDMDKPENCEDCQYAHWRTDTETVSCDIRCELFDDFDEYGNPQKCHEKCPLVDE